MRTYHVVLALLLAIPALAALGFGIYRLRQDDSGQSLRGSALLDSEETASAILPVDSASDAPSSSASPSGPDGISSRTPSASPSLVPTLSPSSFPTASPVEPVPELEIFVQHDFFSGETKWVITDETNGQEVASRESDEADQFQAVSTQILLEPGQYSFEMTDQFGDGICCAAGIGFYELRANNQILTRGGDFAESTGSIGFTVKEDGEIMLYEDAAIMGLPTECFQNDPSRFDICFYLTSKVPGFGTEWIEAFSAAKATWENIILGDERPNGVLLQTFDDEDVAPELPTPIVVDDLLIKGEASDIDGPGKVLGQAGPELGALIGKINPVTGDFFLQVARGSMTFDVADIERLIADGTYQDVIIHEVGHVLGIGTLWDFNGLHSGRDGDPVYNGPLAQEAYKKLGFPGDLEIEIDHGPGTALSHWDEECMDNEVMTGFVDDRMVFSNITVAGMADLGYTVNWDAAEPFSRPAGTFCGQQRRRVRVRQLTESENDKVSLSKEGFEEATGYGDHVLNLRKQRCKEELKKDAGADKEATQLLCLDMTEVLYEENGHVYGVHVGSDL